MVRNVESRMRWASGRSDCAVADGARLKCELYIDPKQVLAADSTHGKSVRRSPRRYSDIFLVERTGLFERLDSFRESSALATGRAFYSSGDVGYCTGLVEKVREMPIDSPTTVIVIYHGSPRNWYFAEVDPTACIYRLGPFDSENAIREILAVIYPADLPRKIVDAPGDYDDVTIRRTAKGAVDAPLVSPCPTGEGGAGASTSWWRLLFGRHAPARKGDGHAATGHCR
ncbi:hypothetical protein [Cupriavidus necator]